MQRRQSAVFLLAAVAGLVLPAYAQENTLVAIDNVRPERIRVEGFRLDNDQKISVEVAGLYMQNGQDKLILGSAWILAADTREVVWAMRSEGRWRYDPDVQRQSDTVDLKRGSYEVYYASYPSYENHGWSFRNDHRWRRGNGGFFSNLLHEIFDGGYDRDWSDHEFDKLYSQLGVVVKGDGQKIFENEIQTKHEALRSAALVAISASHDDLFEKQGFALEQLTKLHIYAIGEARSDGEYDYGWIVDTGTREKVWKFTYRDSEAAGGSEKNRLIDADVSLPAGRYAAMFATDDSHSPVDWNAAPPYDPDFWGLTIRVADGDAAQYAKRYEYKDIEDKNLVVALAPLRDGEFRQKGFTLKRPMDLRVYAIGEGRDGDMFDYGWIVDAKTGKKVWEMDFDDTEHAGGAQKNRMIDQTVAFPAGSYMAYFVTDDSHAYHEWNSSQPFDPEHWGLTVSAADDNFSPSEVAAYQEKDDPNILASVVGVRDDAYRRADFLLKHDSDVRIYALGEGRDGEMFDYGWIENTDTHRTVWEMTYRMTVHAGGASKNRRFDNTIHLRAGEYTVYFKSDGSHSFSDWNAAPPSDPMHWGITVYRTGNK